MSQHNVCDACETYRFCSKNGCIPLTEESAVIGARFVDGGAYVNCDYDEPLTRPERAMGWIAWVVAVVAGVGFLSAIVRCAA